jgi:multidrug efflux system membrane fusion protein
MNWVTLLLLLLLGAGFARSTSAAEDKEETSAKSAPAVKVANGGVEVSVEIQKRLGLEFSPVVAATAAPELLAFGSVVDPTPLVQLDTELRDAEAAVALSETQLRRAQALFGADQTVSRKSLELAESQLRQDTTRREGIARRLQLEWGEVGALAASDRTALVEQLLRRDTALIRVELAVGDTLALPVQAARVRTVGREAWSKATVLGSAPTVDLRSQGQAFLLSLRPAPAGFRPGAAVEARLVRPGPPQKGWRVPRSAVVRHLGRTWIYLQTGEGRFERREVALVTAEGETWFTPTPLPDSARCVSTGAAALLSAEIQAAFGAEGE